jgi:BirA family biotin operon repressor/biotin-[acetyl-CoA-carboxylase] ligase
MGKIIGISDNGNIQIELDNETVKDFGLKEISFV